MTIPYFAGCRGRDASEVDDVLQRYRHPVEGAAILSAGELGVGLLCLCESLICQYRDVGVNRGISLGDPFQAASRGRLGGQLTRADRASQVRNGVGVSGHPVSRCDRLALSGVKGLARRVEVPIRAAQRRGRSRQCLEQRAEAGKVPALRILGRRFEPGLDRHLTVITICIVRQTKIIATIGPASESDDVIRALVGAGVDVFRLNFSHGTHGSHGAAIDRIRHAAAAAGRQVAILQDLSGPKIRTGRLAGGRPLTLIAGQPLVIEVGDFAGEPGRIATTYADLPKAVHPGDALLLDDGRIQLKVEATTDSNDSDDGRGWGRAR